MRVDVLGTPTVLSDDARTVPVPRGRPSTLLAFLAARRGQAVGVDQLVEALWGDTPPRSGSAELWDCVAVLRSVLERATESGGRRLRSGSDGYRLRLENDECDLFEFERLLLAGRGSARAREYGSAADSLRRAIALWHGNPFSGGASAALAAEAQLWDEMRLAAYEDCIEAELRTAPRAELIAELRRLIAENPVRERLRLLHVLLLRAQIAATTPSAPAAPWTTPRQLPDDLADFTGRTSVLTALTSQLSGRGASPTVASTGPVVSVTGCAGAGKTALAVRVAHRVLAHYPDGQLHVPLAGGSGAPRPPAEVLGGVLRDLGLPGSAIPPGLAERTAAYRSRLAGRRVLIVLDDVADATQVRPLLPGTAGSAVLLTSRVRLAGLPVTGRFRLDALSSTEARELLARVIGPERVAAEPECAAELVDLCGRWPLSIRVIATRLAGRPNWPLGSLLSRLHEHHRVLHELALRQSGVRAGLPLRQVGD